ncbi:hypothetical protein HII12_000704 [Brettanomyces bruxellensis]|uniref:U3 small nucleolar RNA-associated protein 5 n=1 Tax=Dekkera bruxellensis TaxID=5007 RepID=A0A8H6BPH7_DEKBR|nr:hypothetical protein HII12_000704 [Brettanomyces bruxellensis]
MRGVVIRSVNDTKGWLVATLIKGHGRNEVQILTTKEDLKQLENKLEFQQDEHILCLRWIQRSKSVDQKVRKRKSNDKPDGISKMNFDYLAVLLATGEILVYSPDSKEFVTKMSNESPLSCICYGGASSIILGYAPSESEIKKYNILDSRPLETYHAKIGKDVHLMQLLDDGLIAFASENLIVYNDEDHEINYTIEAPRTHRNQILQILKSRLNGNLMAISREMDPTINIISLEEQKIMATLRCKGHVLSLVAIRSKKTKEEILVAVTDKGRIEMFRDAFNENGRRQKACDAVLQTDKQLELNGIICTDGKLSVSYFDGYQMKLSPLTISDPGVLSEKKSQAIVIDLDREETAESAKESAPGAVKSSASSKNEKAAKPSSSDADELNTEVLPSLDDPQELYEALVKNMESRKTLKSLLLQNENLCTFFLDEEANTLFQQLTVLICENSNGSEKLIEVVGLLLILKGSYIVKDYDSVELLKLLRSSLVSNLKLLPSLLGLQGRLSLLNSQLKLRSEMALQSDSQEKDTQEDESEEPRADSLNTLINHAVIVDGERHEFGDSAKNNEASEYIEEEGEPDLADLTLQSSPTKA